MKPDNDFKLLSVSEFMALKPPARDWGGWRRKGRILSFPIRGGRTYDFNLARFTSSAALLDMIIQVSQNRATDASIGGFIRAINDILYPQATLCSFGRDRRLTKQQINDRIKACERTA